MPLRTDGDQYRGPAYVAGTVARKDDLGNGTAVT
jgi:hypothetical protein